MVNNVGNHFVRRRGFTLIEVVLAVALTAILLSVLLSVTVATERSRRRMAGTDQRQPHPPAWLPLVENDLARARVIDYSAAAVKLSGPLALNPATLLPTGGEAVVWYEITHTGERHLLLRSEADPAARGLENGSVTALASGITAFAIQPTMHPDSPSESPEPGFSEYEQIATSVAVVWQTERRLEPWRVMIPLH